MLVFAHRGASATAPENTLLAFNLAFEQGAQGIEFDTYQHAGGIVVFHDKTLSRTTNGTGALLDTPFDHLRLLDAGQGQKIPTLTETLATLPRDRWCNIEIKHLDNVKKWVRDVKQALTAQGINPQRLLISSFNHHWLKAISAQWPEVKIGALTASYELLPFTSAKILRAYSVNIALDIANREFVEAALEAGFKVFVYTVDNDEDMKMLKAWGVTGIFTNVPQRASQILASNQ